MLSPASQLGSSAPAILRHVPWRLRFHQFLPSAQRFAVQRRTPNGRRDRTTAARRCGRSPRRRGIRERSCGQRRRSSDCNGLLGSLRIRDLHPIFEQSTWVVFLEIHDVMFSVARKVPPNSREDLFAEPWTALLWRRVPVGFDRQHGVHRNRVAEGNDTAVLQLPVGPPVSRVGVRLAASTPEVPTVHLDLPNVLPFSGERRTVAASVARPRGGAGVARALAASAQLRASRTGVRPLQRLVRQLYRDGDRCAWTAMFTTTMRTNPAHTAAETCMYFRYPPRGSATPCGSR